jgi:hypothetical protein
VNKLDHLDHGETKIYLTFSTDTAEKDISKIAQGLVGSIYNRTLYFFIINRNLFLMISETVKSKMERPESGEGLLSA